MGNAFFLDYGERGLSVCKLCRARRAASPKKDFKTIFYFGAGRIKRARSWLNSLQQKPRQAMAKRLREEACRSEVHRLGDDLWLRVRLADDGVGSLMLFQGRRIFECTQYKEAEAGARVLACP